MAIVRRIASHARRLGDAEYEQRALEHLWKLYGVGDTEIERRFKKTLGIYDDLLSEKNDRRTAATRTRQKLKATSVKQSLIDWALSKSTETSFKLFEAANLKRQSGEQIILDFPNEFEAHVVSAARDRIEGR